MIWDHPSTVARFVGSAPNANLMSFAETLAREPGYVKSLSILDIGCGAGRNALPLAGAGHSVVGIDRSQPMLDAARKGAAQQGLSERCRFVPGNMDRLDFDDASFDLIVAHGVWNLAENDETFLRAVAEAGRVGRPGAGLFVFTFARLGIAPAPLAGRRFVAGLGDAARCFVTETELDEVVRTVGFVRPTGRPLTLYNALPQAGSPPPIFEGTFRKDISIERGG